MIFDFSHCEFELLKKQGGLAYLNSQAYGENSGEGPNAQPSDCQNRPSRPSMGPPYRHSSFASLVTLIDIYEDFEKIQDFKILIIPLESDQLHLTAQREQLDNFLAGGGIVLVFTQNFTPFISALPPYLPSPTPIRSRSIIPTAHPISAGLREYDLTHRRGVRGFFSRGFFAREDLEHFAQHWASRAPSGSGAYEIILRDSDGECIAYAAQVGDRAGGLLIHTAAADLLGYGLFENSTAKRLPYNLLLWLEKYLENENPAQKNAKN